MSNTNDKNNFLDCFARFSDKGWLAKVRESYTPDPGIPNGMSVVELEGNVHLFGLTGIGMTCAHLRRGSEEFLADSDGEDAGGNDSDCDEELNEQALTEEILKAIYTLRFLIQREEYLQVDPSERRWHWSIDDLFKVLDLEDDHSELTDAQVKIVDEFVIPRYEVSKGICLDPEERESFLKEFREKGCVILGAPSGENAGAVP